jgi:hypothetical protein
MIRFASFLALLVFACSINKETLSTSVHKNYCQYIGGCTLAHPTNHVLLYANSVNEQARHLSTLTQGLSFITHPSKAPLYANAIAKMSIHIRHGSNSPSKFEAANALDDFKLYCESVEDALYDASGVVSVRLDKIIEGVDHLHTMLNRTSPEAVVKQAYEQFLITLDDDLGRVAVVLARAREVTSKGKGSGEIAYNAVFKVTKDVNDAIDDQNRWNWLPSITKVQRVGLSLQLVFVYG